MTVLIVVAIVVGVLALIGTIVVIAIKIEKKRSEALQAAAERMKFTFSRKGDPDLLDRLKGLHLFSQGHSKKITNVLMGKAGALDVAVFEYAYTTGGGQHSQRWRQTVILFESDGMDLPKFTLRPENIFHKIGQVFGYKDIDFDSHPEFSKRYLLKGENEEAVRATFGTEARSFYESDLKLSTEAAGPQLIHYRSGKRVSPDEISEFIKQGVRVLTLFRK
jgi:hypothetical protein